MTEPATDSLQLLSVLLHYPDDQLLNRLDEAASVADQSCRTEIKSAVTAFVENLKTLTPIQAQENYTALFDMNPSTTLNMTYHTYGDNEKRAAALAQLQHTYQQAGWQRTTGELPDYLPLMLEFLSICPHPQHTEPVWHTLQGIQPLVARLEKKASVYAALLQPIVRMAVEHGASVDNGDHPPPEKA
jgi:nitrate reductase delta subunit